MKKLIGIFIMLLSVSVMAGNGEGKMDLGDKAALTHIKMLDVSGEKISLGEAQKDNGLVVIFSCNTCPFVKQWEDRYPEIKKWADKNDVGMIVLNSNYQNRDGVDSYEAMQKHAETKGYNFHYVVDEESQIANAFGGQTTPHVFLFDSNMELAYKGAIDDSYKSADEVKQAYLKDAIVSLASNEKIAVNETKPTGCSIKRKVQ
ncbi:redoxin domain-containing protein [Maribellus comscasis]|uniref:Redoxin domain-containing protein n=1 Tax=Maribellus comscasis TaxID=2681766 RepID=A0A6I6JSM4_9BACT|nr:redoxin domain-containing protein [Maribellus comscasis]QGY45451.1 redoxin domain-containing protein [Maribellus comscasis]